MRQRGGYQCIVMYLAWLSFTKTLFQVIHVCIKYLNEGLTEFNTTAPCMTTILKYVVYLMIVYRDTYLISCRFWIERKPEIYRRLTRSCRHTNMLQAGMRPSQAPLRLVSRYACLVVASGHCSTHCLITLFDRLTAHLQA